MSRQRGARRLPCDCQPSSESNAFGAGAVRIGVISRSAQERIAFILAAIGTDPTLGLRIEDIDERDVAPPMDNGKSVGGASLQVVCTFYTPRRDHFTIIGVGGDLF